MNKWVKQAGLAVLTAAVLLTVTLPAFAATSSRKKITSVKFTVDSNILPDTDMGDEQIDIKLPSSAKFEYDSYEILNFGSEWDETMIPELKIMFTAKDGYYFALKKASAVTIQGATYVTAEKQDSSSVLIVTVKLPSLEESIGELGEVTLTDGGYIYWEPVQGAGSYEMRIYRNGTAMNVTEMTTVDTMNNIQEKLKRTGSYSVKVRARNKIREDKKTEWVESNTINFTAEQIENIKDGKAPEPMKKGDWRQTEGRWWYCYEDDTYPKNEWKQIAGKWYLFDEEGYIRTGWVEWEGEEYYCDQNTGAMLTNTVTPDGYHLNSKGIKQS